LGPAKEKYTSQFFATGTLHQQKRKGRIHRQNLPVNLPWNFEDISQSQDGHLLRFTSAFRSNRNQKTGESFLTEEYKTMDVPWE
jgi:hypothetical protein